jgi:hypothetical protein
VGFIEKVDVEFDFEVLDAVLDGFEGEVHVMGDRNLKLMSGLLNVNF